MGKLVFIRKLKLKTTFLFFVGMLIGQLVLAQGSKTITGTITEPDGSTPLPGVAIMEKGTSNGTITDLDGNYSIKVTDDNAVLIISFMGYETQEVAVSGQSSISASLVAKDETLDEVVIVGYGEIKKRDVTGSVGTLDEEALTAKGVGNPMEAIQGNIAGVQISSSTGRIGDAFDITIRGQNSLNEDSKPLYIVDGVPTDGIDFLNPQDIERIDVLKDASSTAIYGSRGSNGVVIVTTKGGATAKKGMNVSFDSYYGVKKAARLPDVMDGQTWFNYHKAAYMGNDPMSLTPESLRNIVAGAKAGHPLPDGQNELLFARAAANETFDWTGAILQNGMTANNYLSISGQGNGISYNLGIGVQNEEGLIKKESLDKYTLKAGIDHKVNEVLSIGTNLTISKSELEQGNDIAMTSAFRMSPLMNPYSIINPGELWNKPGKLQDADGHYYINKTSTWNPLIEIAGGSDLTKRLNIIGSTYAELKPLDWLSLKSTLSIGADNKNRGQSWDASTETANKKGGPVARITKSSDFNYTWDNQFNINYSIDETHNFSLLGLQSLYSTKYEESMSYSDNMPFETGVHNLSSGTQSTFNMSSSYAKQTLASFAIRLNYNYKGKYLLTLSNRWDGSSLLSKGNKWASFPSGALAWRLSEEEFMHSQNFISNMKLRASYGFTGNNIISPYSTVNKLDKQTYYSFDEETVNGWLPSALSNNLLTWEKTRELNVGLDFGLLKNRITGTIDVYDRLSDELLMEQNLPLESGWDKINANVGSVSNKGFEIGLTTVNVNTSLVRWETTFLFSKNTNKIVSLYGQKESDDIGNQWFIDEDINSEYNYRFDGIVQANEDGIFGLDEGMAKVADINGDGEITADQDRIILGNNSPDWTGSLNTKLIVGDFDLSATIITTQGTFVNSPFLADALETRQRGRQKLNIQVYVPENGAGMTPHFSNEYPRPRAEGTYWNDSDVGFYADASFVKVKNISIGYTLPSEILSKVKVKSLRVYFNVIDPFVFTDYKGFDPEWADASLNLGRVASITYQFGLNLKF